MLTLLCFALLLFQNFKEVGAPKVRGEFNLHNVKLRFQPLLRTWADASEWCEQWGGYLATMRTQAELNFIKRKLESDNGFWWIGVNDLAVEGKYQYPDDSTALFTDWFLGFEMKGMTSYNKKPQGGAVRNCVELRNELLDYRNRIVTLPYHVWADSDCGAKRYFICEQRDCGDDTRYDVILGCPLRTLTSVRSCVVKKSTLTSVPLIQTKTAKTLLQCVVTCQSTQNCLSVNFDQSSCSLLAGDMETLGASVENTSALHVSIGRC